MNARNKQDPPRRVLSGVVGGVNKRRSRPKGLDYFLGNDVPRRLDHQFTGPADFVGASELRRSSWTGKGTTPHSAKKPTYANGLSITDDLGIMPVTHALIVITGDEPAALTEAINLIREHPDPLDLAILASLLIEQEGNDKPKQPGGTGMIPQTQTMVFARPGGSSSLRIRVVPSTTECMPLVPYSDWSRMVFAPDRHKSFAPKSSLSHWLNGS